MALRRWESIAGNLVLITELLNRSDEGLTLETSAFLPFTAANLLFSTQLLTLNYPLGLMHVGTWKRLTYSNSLSSTFKVLLRLAFMLCKRF